MCWGEVSSLSEVDRARSAKKAVDIAASTRVLTVWAWQAHRRRSANRLAVRAMIRLACKHIKSDMEGLQQVEQAELHVQHFW